MNCGLTVLRCDARLILITTKRNTTTFNEVMRILNRVDLRNKKYKSEESFETRTWEFTRLGEVLSIGERCLFQ